MDKMNVLTAATLAVLGLAISAPAFAYVSNEGGGALVATPEQIEQCKTLGIPEFTCTEQAILAKLRVIEAEKPGAYGSGTAMFGKSFGDMGGFVVAVGVIFGGVAAAFFTRAKIGQKVPI